MPSKSLVVRERTSTAIGRSRSPAAPEAFRPSARQLAYLQAWLDPNKSYRSYAACAAAAGIPYATVYSWLRTPAFADWWAAQMQHFIDHHVGPVAMKLAQMALAGSAKHAELFLQFAGRLQPIDAGQRGPSVQVVIGVPRAVAPVELSQVEPDIDIAPGLPSHTAELDQ